MTASGAGSSIAAATGENNLYASFTLLLCLCFIVLTKRTLCSDITKIEQQWEQFSLRIDSFEAELNGQVERYVPSLFRLRLLLKHPFRLKSEVKNRISEFKKEISRFVAQWKEDKPKEVAIKDKDAAATIVAKVMPHASPESSARLSRR